MQKKNMYELFICGEPRKNTAIESSQEEYQIEVHR